MRSHLRSILIRRTVLASTVLTLGTAGAGAAYVHVAAAPSPSTSTSPAPADGKDGHLHRHAGRHILRALIRDTATQTKQTPAQVLTQLRAGKTLREVAGEKAGTVEADAIAAAKTRLDRAVSRGRIDAAKEQAMLATLGTRVHALMGKNLVAELQRGQGHHGPVAAPKPPAAVPSGGAPAQA